MNVIINLLFFFLNLLTPFLDLFYVYDVLVAQNFDVSYKSTSKLGNSGFTDIIKFSLTAFLLKFLSAHPYDFDNFYLTYLTLSRF
jgi:hypothetical protein